jgi:hypothetical protein
METNEPVSTQQRGIEARRIAALVVTVLVLGFCAMYLIRLALTHTVGAEIYGVLVAGVATATALASLALLATEPRRSFATALVLGLWLVVAIGGIAGVAAHVIAPVAGHGPVDDRARPVAAPLIFTVSGVIGAVALYVGPGRHGAARY